MWIGLPAHLDATEVVRRAESEEKLTISPGDAFQVPEDSKGTNKGFSDHLRLCLAWEEPRHLTEGVRRLACVLNRMART
jgi:DNA-binding transcriptional MocR family regulator